MPLAAADHGPHDPHRGAACGGADAHVPGQDAGRGDSHHWPGHHRRALSALQFLAAVGVNLAPLLASAGVAGVAIGLAAQNIVKDMLNGMLILIEDQFNVGDTVRLAGWLEPWRR